MLMYGGSAYAYANDPDFESVKWSKNKWQEAIDAFYAKYKDLAAWHTSIYKEVVETGQLRMPTGRVFTFESKPSRFGPKWPRTEILNFPVQGTGADLVAITRTLAFQRIKKEKLKALFVSTVHDSILCDCPTEEAKYVGQILLESIQATPKRFSELFNVNFDLPLTGEVEMGYNYKQMEDITKEIQIAN